VRFTGPSPWPSRPIRAIAVLFGSVQMHARPPLVIPLPVSCPHYLFRHLCNWPCQLLGGTMASMVSRATPTLEPYVDVEVASGFLHLAPKTLNEWARQGKIPPTRSVTVSGKPGVSSSQSWIPGCRVGYTASAARLFLKGERGEKEAHKYRVREHRQTCGR
jgi:hypothetical protein